MWQEENLEVQEYADVIRAEFIVLLGDGKCVYVCRWRSKVSFFFLFFLLYFSITI